MIAISDQACQWLRDAKETPLPYSLRHAARSRARSPLPCRSAFRLAQLCRGSLGLALGDLRGFGLILGGRKLGLGVGKLVAEIVETAARVVGASIPACRSSATALSARSARVSACSARLSA
jgi:hypothetical protein